MGIPRLTLGLMINSTTQLVPGLRLHYIDFKRIVMSPFGEQVDPVNACPSSSNM
jgi:hypothetical protein